MGERKRAHIVRHWFDRFFFLNFRCGNCGKRVGAWYRFCDHCGVRFIDHRRYCPKCGYQVESGDNFCHLCGAEVK